VLAWLSVWSEVQMIWMAKICVCCLQKMQAAGVNVFPAEDSFKYVKILDKVNKFIFYSKARDFKF